MRKLKIALLAAAAALFAVACATSTPTNTTINSGRTVTVNANASPADTPAPAADDLASARATYAQVCAKCHKENGEGGDAELDGGTKLNVPSFKTAHSIGHTDEQYTRKINDGDPREGMPAFKGRLSPEQIAGLVRLIRRDFQSAGPKEGAGHANSH